jgi:cysteinyl-tRNA synthetase
VDELQDAQTHWDNFVRDIPEYVFDDLDNNAYFEQALNALDDDFNTPQVIIVLHEGLKNLRRSKSLHVAEDVLKVFKLLSVVPSDATLETVYEKWMTEAAKPSAEIVELVNKRQQAKLDNNYTLADEYRQQVQSQGWQILDKGDTFELRKI